MCVYSRVLFHAKLQKRNSLLRQCQSQCGVAVPALPTTVFCIGVGYCQARWGEQPDKLLFAVDWAHSLCVEIGFYGDISQKSRCISEVIHSEFILMKFQNFFNVLAEPKAICLQQTVPSMCEPYKESKFEASYQEMTSCIEQCCFNSDPYWSF